MDSSKIILYTVILLYIALMVYVGFYFRRKVQTSSGFWTADGSIGWFVNSFAILATLMSGGGMLGNIGSGATLGIIIQLMGTLAAGIGTGVAAVLVAGPLRKSRARTLSDFYHIRFNSKAVGTATGVVVLITYSVYLMAQLKAGGTVSEFLLDVPYMAGVLVVWGVFTLYTILGGMLAVTWNDFIQGVLMVVVVVVSAVVGLSFYGWDFGHIMSLASEYNPNIGLWYLPSATNLGVFVTWILAGLCAPTVLMRMATAKSPFSAGLSMQTSMLWLTIFSAGTIIILSPVTRAFAGPTPLENADAYYMVFVRDQFGPILQGLVAAAIFAAIMSTAAGLLLAAAAALSNDIIKRFRSFTPKGDHRLGIVCILIIAVVVLVASNNPPPLLSVFYSQAMTFLVCSLFPAYFLGMWWRRTTAPGALAGILGGGVCFVLCNFVIGVPLLSEAVYSVPVGLVCTVVVSLLTKKPDDKTIQMMESWHDASDYHDETKVEATH